MKRIVISGLGVVSSIGIGKDAFWSALTKGTSGISTITSFDTSPFSTHKGGEIKDFKPEQFIDPKNISDIGRASLLAMAAGKLAYEDARLSSNVCEPERFGICFGTTMTETRILEELNAAWVKTGAMSIDPALAPRYPAYVLSSNIALMLGLKGPNYTIPTACAAGNYAIGYAYDLIRNGEADVMLAGGADAFSRLAFIGFNRLLAVAPERVQPFDKNRKGMMVGEGAGMLILETLENALKRKASIYAEILGYGLSCDANHMTNPHPDGITRCINAALQNAGLTYKDVDYICAHGTGTVFNDLAESKAINNVFKERTLEIPVNSLKSMLGHTMGSASAIEAISCCLTVKNGMIPPTINFETPDPECRVDCVPNLARKKNVRIALNNAFAFGGNNSCLVIKKYERA